MATAENVNFVEKRSAKLSKCTARDGVFCMTAPTDLKIPGTYPARKFRVDGCSCWLRFHGYDNFPAIQEAYGQK